MSNQLPAGFATLEPFVDFWSIPGTAARDVRRGESTEEQRQAFYEAARELVAPALAFLDQTPLAAFDAAQERLMNLLLSFAHVVEAVELLGKGEARHTQFRKEMRLTRTSAGL